MIITVLEPHALHNIVINFYRYFVCINLLFAHVREVTTNKTNQQVLLAKNGGVLALVVLACTNDECVQWSY